MINRGIDIQVWIGKQTSLLAENFTLDNDPNLEKHMFQYAHTWKTPASHEETMALHQRAFSIWEGNDRIVQKYNMSGEFSVGSAYWVLTNKNRREMNPEVWKRLWRLNIPYKMIVFLWKLYDDCLMVQTSLHKRIP